MAPAATQRDAHRPNIIVILVDDMGFSDIGCYGSEIRTPNLNRLASGGLVFQQMYNCSRCCPTRASLLTGLYPHRAGVGAMVKDMGHAPYQGYLVVRSPARADVFEGQTSRGPTNRKLVLRCRDYTLRLRDVHTQRWLSDARTVSVSCQKITTVVVTPEAR